MEGASRAVAARAAIALLVLLTACATLRGIEEPEVSVTGMRPAKVGLFEQQLGVGLRISNPNDFPLEVRGVRFTIEMDGERLASGQDDVDVTVPAHGDREIGVRANAESLAVLRQLMRASWSSDLAYEVQGELLLDNDEADEVGFEHTSRLLGED